MNASGSPLWGNGGLNPLPENVQMSLIEVDPNSPVPEGMKEAVFVAVTAWSKVYEFYDDPGVDREKAYPMVMMSARWDGKYGFVGGFREKGHSLIQTAEKELMEEAAIVPTADLVHVASHQERIRVHCYQYDLGYTPVNILKILLQRAAQAEHAVAEGCMVWAHLADYNRDKGYPTFVQNKLAMAVAEELAMVRALMYSPAQLPRDHFAFGK